MTAPKVTPKQALFVQEYLIDLNATQAAKRAGYSKHTAKQMGTENLSKPSISGLIKAALDKRAVETGITAAWVLEQAADVYEEARKAQDRTNALKALDQCGKHVDVQAFKETLRNEHTDGDGKPLIPVFVPVRSDD